MRKSIFYSRKHTKNANNIFHHYSNVGYLTYITKELEIVFRVWIIDSDGFFIAYSTFAKVFLKINDDL